MSGGQRRRPRKRPVPCLSLCPPLEELADTGASKRRRSGEPERYLSDGEVEDVQGPVTAALSKKGLGLAGVYRAALEHGLVCVLYLLNVDYTVDVWKITHEIKRAGVLEPFYLYPLSYRKGSGGGMVHSGAIVVFVRDDGVSKNALETMHLRKFFGRKVFVGRLSRCCKAGMSCARVLPWCWCCFRESGLCCHLVI